jgi:hypothetical protein
MNRHLLAVLPACIVLLVALAVPACAQVSSEKMDSSSKITGVIREVARQQPLVEALIIAHNQSTGLDRTAAGGAGGVFSISNLEPGRYEVAAHKEGFVGSSASVEVGSTGTFQIDLSLAKSPADLPAKAAPAERNPRTIALISELEAMKKRIEELELELKKEQSTTAAEYVPQGRGEPAARTLLATIAKDAAVPILPGTLGRAQEPKSGASEAAAPLPASSAAEPLPQAGKVPVAQPPTPLAPPEHIIPDALQAPPASWGTDNFTPFAFGDFSWLNGSARTKDTVLDTKYFTPEVRFDTHYMTDFNQPIDHTIVGSTESFRSGEVQLEQISVGGALHWENVRGRILYMDGLFVTTTPRNDASAGVGQWDLRDAYRHVSEAYGGYHFDVNHGLNVDAGIFVSYIGLFSYYNFDNWTYQPSYVSSNTPWFFNGVRIQWFPTNKLKIEPWLINGWQSYAKYNGHPGLGGQLLWMPREWFKLVANQYGYGQDNLGLPKTERIHTDRQHRGPVL